MQTFLLPSAADKLLDMAVGRIENGLERGFVKHQFKLSFNNRPTVA